MISTRWDQILGWGQTEVVKRNGEKGAPEHQPPAPHPSYLTSTGPHLFPLPAPWADEDGVAKATVIHHMEAGNCCYHGNCLLGASLAPALHKRDI